MISNKDFEKVIDCLPEGFTWGQALTPHIALHIVNVAESSAIKQLEADLAESQKVIKVVDGLVTAKGRYHTAQWYQKMVTALDEYKAAIKEQQ
jgi:hypothetical protein